MNIITIEEQTFKQMCGRFSGFVSLVERICKENTHQPEKWLSGREVCALLGISIRSLQNYRDSGKLGYSQIGNKLYYKSADIERLIAECTENKKTNYQSNNK
ncbi:helix-turn-helix domain-containing protein [Parabacteroides distasonis]|uniref:Helix-turn-helix domain-containing protein n=1 Tax=Parabacteroides distasonis TaxID=823 RepID=A0A7L5E6Q1_PARDI|nr:helix-turn-helix domain-containing protein [Parabacteroides distasonis]QJE27166.1 helix-turn-helix domain-containing protein [Parabacteroides distasonis]WRY42926.1 helix-turn-helix domain-containing protein [Parabacteroides distasonis]